MKKDIIILAAVLLLICVLISGTKIQSVEEYYLVHIDDVTPQSKTVTLGINCSEILDNYQNLDHNLKDSSFVPENGVILSNTVYVCTGDTALTLLLRAARKNNIPVTYQGAKSNNLGSAYVTGINNITEFACGELSGWTFTINGVYPDKGCSDCIINDGDTVEWIFSCSE